MMSPDYVPDFTHCLLPYVKWFQDDFVGGVRGMRAHEIGIYTMLLMEMYTRGRALDMPRDRLARLCGADRRAFDKALDDLIAEGKIIQLDCGLWNERCENAFRERAKMQKSQQEAGKTSAEKRSKNSVPSERPLNGGSAAGQPSSEAQNREEEENTRPNGLVSETDVSDAPRRRTRNAYPDAFDAVWSAYPTDQNMSKAKAFAAWKRLSAEDRDSLAASIPAFVAFCRKDPTYRPVHMVRFITERRFEGFVGANRATAASAEQWQQRLEYARQRRTWSSSEWGPMPGAPKCLVPAELIQPGDGEGWSEWSKAA